MLLVAVVLLGGCTVIGVLADGGGDEFERAQQDCENRPGNTELRNVGAFSYCYEVTVEEDGWRMCELIAGTGVRDPSQRGLKNINGLGCGNRTPRSELTPTTTPTGIAAEQAPGAPDGPAGTWIFSDNDTYGSLSALSTSHADGKQAELTVFCGSLEGHGVDYGSPTREPFSDTTYVEVIYQFDGGDLLRTDELAASFGFLADEEAPAYTQISALLRSAETLTVSTTSTSNTPLRATFRVAGLDALMNDHCAESEPEPVVGPDGEWTFHQRYADTLGETPQRLNFCAVGYDCAGEYDFDPTMTIGCKSSGEWYVVIFPQAHALVPGDSIQVAYRTDETEFTASEINQGLFVGVSQPEAFLGRLLDRAQLAVSVPAFDADYNPITATATFGVSSLREGIMLLTDCSL